MMAAQEIREQLAQKKSLLEKIADNTGIQERFVGRREMRGLGRLLRERAALIADLAAVNKRLTGERLTGPLAAEARALTARQREIIAACEHVIRQASAERARIAAELKNSRLMRTAKNNYVNKWAVMSFSNRLNVNG